MTGPDDVPDFPYPKPVEIARLEQLPPEVIHAMMRVEVEEKVREAANSLVATYMRYNPENANYEECQLLVSAALQETGWAIQGQLGLLLVATCQRAAEEASREYFPDETILQG